MGASYLTTGKETLVENIPVSNTYTGAKPKNIILLIGDGMGLAQITAGLYANGNSLQLEKFPITGLILTHSARQLITDSAAGATAFSCGCKTNNGYIGVTTKKKPCLTILEQAKKEGKAVGLVASSSLTHATPASFIAHVADRGESENIATFFADTEVDLSIGGGMQYFNQRKTDQRDIYKELAQKGVVISDFTKQSLSEVRPDPANPFMWFAAEKEPASATEGRTYLPLAARLATTFLKKRSEKGFFLMLEGSQIDWACHAKKGPEAVREMLDFDNAIGEILRFAQRDGETLVIVTADHETGGMTLEQSNTPDNVDLDFNTGNHTASMVPVFAFGPGAELFGGLYDNTEIYVKMRDLFGCNAARRNRIDCRRRGFRPHYFTPR
ncbi:MAG: alkaline phosphatase [Lewinellaceae bacterium]|nr:alkaline phosphatase [Lewinellaceae bacterium]